MSVGRLVLLHERIRCELFPDILRYAGWFQIRATRVWCQTRAPLLYIRLHPNHPSRCPTSERGCVWTLWTLSRRIVGRSRAYGSRFYLISDGDKVSENLSAGLPGSTTAPAVNLGVPQPQL